MREPANAAINGSRQLRHDRPHTGAREPLVECTPDGLQRLFDATTALTMLVLTAPVLLLAALAVKLTSRGPAFFSQVRMGRGGRPFTLHKLRTMTHNCEQLSGPRWSTPGDARVTRIGHFLRRSHIDELPQLWNIVCGHMSLVGPRPERPEFLPQLDRAIPRYRDRLAVRPGLTGLAQVQLPPDTDFESVRRKLACDLFYIAHRSLWLDFRILLSTVALVLKLPIHWRIRWLALPGGPAVENAYHRSLPAEPRSSQLHGSADGAEPELGLSPIAGG